MSVRIPRRLAAAVTGVAVVATALSGCGAADREAGAATGATRSITDATGKQVEVPEQPQRVVALAETDIDAVFALGVKPAGISTGRQQQAAAKYLGERTAGIPVVGELQRPNLDKIIEAQPDLILAGSIADEQVLEQMRKVAPTVVTNRNDEDWKVSLDRVAETLGKQDTATTVLAEHDRRVAEVKGKLGANANASVSIVRWNAQGPSFMLNDAFPSKVVGELGLRRPDAQQQPGFSPSKPLSLEALGQLDGDWLFLGTLTSDGKDALGQVQASPAFQQLGAVKSGHLVAVDGEIWTSRGGPIAAGVLLDDIATRLAG